MVQINSSGLTEAVENIDLGYSENNCIRCYNSFGGHIDYDNWRIEQTYNCAKALITNTVNPIAD